MVDSVKASFVKTIPLEQCGAKKLQHPKNSSPMAQTAAVAAGIAVGVIAFLVAVFTCCWCCCRDKPRYNAEGVLIPAPAYSIWRPTTWRYAPLFGRLPWRNRHPHGVGVVHRHVHPIVVDNVRGGVPLRADPYVVRQPLIPQPPVMVNRDPRVIPVVVDNVRGGVPLRADPMPVVVPQHRPIGVVVDNVRGGVPARAAAPVQRGAFVAPRQPVAQGVVAQRAAAPPVVQNRVNPGTRI